MQFFILLLITTTVTFPFLESIGLLPSLVGYLPELFGMGAAAIAVALGVRNGFRFVRPAYWFIFGAIATIMLFGVLANGVGAGPIFAGIRNYGRAIPLFFLGAVYPFSERQIRQQLTLLLALGLMQLPLAIYQRMQPGVTGDAVFGTLMISSLLSMFLIGAACLLTAFYVRGELKLGRYLLLIVIVLLPMSMNETKGTLLLLPVALLVTFLVAARHGERLKNLIIGTAVIVISAAIFVQIYDYTQRDRVSKYTTETPTVAGWLEEGRLSKYLFRGNDELGATEQKDVRRGDALLATLRYLGQDPARLAFGLGLGNASESSLGQKFTGRYFRQFEFYLLQTASRVLLETGVLGLSLMLILMWQIGSDSRRLPSQDRSIFGTVAAGWAGVVVTLTLGMFYKDFLPSPALVYLFWFYSGVVAAQFTRLSRSRVGATPRQRDGGMGIESP